MKMNKFSSNVKHLKIKKGDKVKVLLGKDRGKEGKVEFVVAKTNRVFVGGLNMYKRHVKKQKGLEGGIIEIPKSLDISNVALICPNCKKTTRNVKNCIKCKKEIKTNAKA